jgi:restriction system protein
MVDVDAIRREVAVRKQVINVTAEWTTPSGRPRSAPIFVATIRNAYLRQEQVVRASDAGALKEKAQKKLEAWADEEIRRRTREAKEVAAEETEDANRESQDAIDGIRGILVATLSIDDRINWDSLYERTAFREFTFRPTPEALLPPGHPPTPKQSFWSWLFPKLRVKWVAECERVEADYQASVTRVSEGNKAAVARWELERSTAVQEHERGKQAFLGEQQKRNDSVSDFRRRFEGGERPAVEEYLRMVFERSAYPEGFPVEHAVAFDPASTTVLVDVELPERNRLPDVEGYKYVATRNERKPILMKPKDHESLYDRAIKDTVVRTLHEVFEAVYTPHVQSAVVNGWVPHTDPATGNDVRPCVISVSATRREFETFNLAKIDTNECVRKLKGLTAGPLSQVGPVKPILQLNREDARFIEAREVLDGVSADQNLAEMDWEDFEHLVRELCGKMFSAEGAEVKVTQASRDQGVDAVAFDPDPIRGGKFVIQAKRYTKVVPVSAVRDLYGTMLNEGAVKGILVTTAHYGPDSREFAKDKPITLIDGSNLVYLLEQYGYHVRLDVEAARRKANLQA